MKKAGLYIHIPFCHSKCPYCDFYSLPSLTLKEEFLAALKVEMELYRGIFPLFNTLYIGGGTPSVLPPAEIGEIVNTAMNLFSFSSRHEVTMEVNPADIDLNYLRELKAAGVNRISLGVQSFDDSVLRFLGRRHNSLQALKAVEVTRKAGFSNFGLDLIYGVPIQQFSSWEESLSLAVHFQVPHLSCYQLSLSRETPLGRSVARGEIILPGQEETAKLMAFTTAYLEAAGYERYEVSNFAKGEAFRSRHNRKYWEDEPYLGLGPSAHSFDGSKKRWWNNDSVTLYIKSLREKKLPLADEEILNEKERMLECLFLGLRTKRGVSLKKLGGIPPERRNEAVNYLTKEGLATIKKGRLRPTAKGLALADGLAVWISTFAESPPSLGRLTP